MNSKRMDGYIRQSRSPKNGEGISPSQQKDRIQAWADARGVEIVAWHQDIDQSGSKLIRPGLDAMLERIESGQTSGVVVAKLDRLSRAGLIDTLKIIERIHEAGAVLASDDFGLDPTTKEGEFMLGIILGLARLEWRRAAEDWEDAKERAADRGIHIAKTPLGYRKGEAGVLEPDELAPLISRAYELSASEGVTAAKAWLRAADPDAPRGRWTNLRRILSKRVYLGETGWNGHTVVEAHEPLTDLATWTRAQIAVDGRKPSGHYPLSRAGVVCDTCGTDMVGSKAGERRKYRCGTGGGRDGGREGSCAAKAWIGADALERFLLEYVLVELEHREANPEDYPDWAPAPVGASGSAEAEERALANAKARRDEFAAADLDISPEVFAARVQALDAAVGAAEVAYLEALSSLVPARWVIRSDELRERGVEALPAALERLGLRPRVRPGRLPAEERVVLRP